MPKINQMIVIEPGGARRLMVRGKGRLTVEDITGTRWTGSHWKEAKVSVKLDGPYIGTKKVPKANAKKHPETGVLQTKYILVRHPTSGYFENIHGVPPSDVEFYWQRGQVKNGRFYPD